MIVILTMPNCQNCSALATFIEGLGMSDKVAWHNASDHMDLCRKFNIRHVPAVLVYNCAADQDPVRVITDTAEINDFFNEVKRNDK